MYKVCMYIISTEIWAEIEKVIYCKGILPECFSTFSLFSFASKILLTLTKGNQHVQIPTYMCKHELICLNYFLRAKGIYTIHTKHKIKFIHFTYYMYVYMLFVCICTHENIYHI